MYKFVCKYSIFLLLVFFFLLYFVTSVLIIDPDFGWEIPLGNYILKHGVPERDLFSYTMPSYPFVDHEWITHAVIAFLYNFTGMAGPAVLFGGIATGVLYAATWNAPRAWRHITIILLGMLLLQETSVRPSIISLFLFAVITQLIINPELWKRWRWFLPVLFLVWANLHGGFVFGLGTVGLFTALTIIERKKIQWRDATILAASISVTFINPYGLRLWHEVFLSVFDTRLRITVNEWMPTIIALDPSIWLFIAVMTAYMIAGRANISMKFRIFFTVFLLLGLSSYRNVALFAVFATGVSTFAYRAIQQATVKSSVFKKRFATFHSTFFKLLLAGMVLHISTLHRINIRNNSERAEYPIDAISYLRNHSTRGNMLSLYEWGGYLLWKYPGKKVFVDGRMPSWRLDPIKHPDESPDVTWDYLEMFRFKKPFKPYVTKYNITSILIKTKMITVDAKSSKKRAQEVQLLKNQLAENNMKIVYQDNIATLFALQEL